jgi:hypothetical protein
VNLFWKGPAALIVSAPQGAAPAPPNAPDDFSTDASRSPYSHNLVGRLSAQLRKANRLNRLNRLNLSPLQTFLLLLRADASAKFLGRSTIEGRPALGMEFPNAMSAFPLSITVRRIKLWIREEDGLPGRLRLFTEKEGVLTFDFTYSSQKDAAGVEYCLPDVVTLYPAEAEDLPSAAYPARFYFSEYKINVEIADAVFE